MNECVKLDDAQLAGMVISAVRMGSQATQSVLAVQSGCRCRYRYRCTTAEIAGVEGAGLTDADMTGHTECMKEGVNGQGMAKPPMSRAKRI